MKTCKNCEYWSKKEPKYEGDAKNAGVCSNDKFVFIGIYDESEKLPDDGLSYWDFDNYFAEFNTGKDFGCIHFETSKGDDC